MRNYICRPRERERERESTAGESELGYFSKDLKPNPSNQNSKMGTSNEKYTPLM